MARQQLVKGNFAFEEGRYEEAVRYFREATHNDSLNAEAWNNLGLAHLKQDESDPARFAFARAIMLDPTAGEALLNHARTGLHLHQYFSVLQDMDDLDRIWPDSSIILFTRGLCFHAMGRLDQALGVFQQALRADPDNYESYINIGSVLYQMDRLDSAEWYSWKGLSINSQEANGYNTLSLIYLKKMEWERALVLVDSALKLSPGQPYYLNNKGQIEMAMGHYSSAESLFNQSMRIDPYNARVYRNKGILMLKNNRPNEAVRLIAKALQLGPASPDMKLDLATAYLANDEGEKACNLLNDVTTPAAEHFKVQNCQ